MKRVLGLLLPMTLLVVLVGCTQLFTQLGVLPLSQEGEVSEVDGGYVAHWSLTGGSGEIVVNFGDGESGRFDDVALIDHLYAKAGTYRVVFSRRGRPTYVDVVVTAPDFDLNYPFWHEGDLVDEREEIRFDPFPRTTGCDNGAPISYYGVWPENDSFYKDEWMFREKWNTDRLSGDFEMRVYVINSDGSRGHVFGKDAQLITGQWVPLQTFRVLADWPWTELPYPIEILTKDCGPVVCPDDPWIPPVIPVDAGRILLRLEVRSKWGIAKAVQWNLFLNDGGCS